MILWGVSTVLEKVGLARMDSIAYGLIRPLVASLVLLPYVAFTAGFALPSRDVLLVAILGGAIDLFLGAGLFLFAMRRISAHKVGPLSNTAPLWGVIAAAVWLRESPTWATYVATISVVAGSYLLTAGGDTLERWRSAFPGLLAALGAGLCWGIADTAIAKYCLTHGMHHAMLVLVYMLSATCCWGVVALLGGRLRRAYFGWRGVRIGILTALTGMVGGAVLWFTALDLAQASVLSPVRGALTVVVFLLSIMFLRERPTRWAGVGVGLVAAGVGLVSALG